MKLGEALALPEGPERTTAIVAWIQSLFREGDQVPILVGGAAVEIFTGGAYTTGDLDFVTTRSSRNGPTADLKRWTDEDTVPSKPHPTTPAQLR